MKSLFAAMLMLLAGCDLYFSDGDDECLVFPAAEIAPNELRDPFTGQCTPFGGYPCDSRCGPCPDVAAQPDYAQCFSECEGLQEGTCAANPSCRVIYDANSEIDLPPQFLDCWGVAPSGPVQGSCEGLDAYGCSQHNDCIAMYDDFDQPPGQLAFSRCVAEAPGCFSTEECGAGTHCSTDDGECLPPPGCEGDDTACPAVCFGTCVANSPTCAAVDCAPGTHCEEHCTVDSNGNITCDVTCVPDTTACGPGECPPNSTCEQVCTDDPSNPGCGVCTTQCVPVGTCESVGDEQTCRSRTDCSPVYEGTDCTCYQDGTCECENLTYDHCATK